MKRLPKLRKNSQFRSRQIVEFLGEVQEAADKARDEILAELNELYSKRFLKHSNK